MRQDWKLIPHTDNYYINSSGDVKYVYGSGERLLREVYKGCYRAVSVRYKGKRRVIPTHLLVWETFKGPIPEGMVVRHGFGNDTLCCDLEYLSLGTLKDNSADQKRDGCLMTNNKVTAEQVLYIRARLADGMTGTALSKLFGLSKVAISDIKLRKTWQHI